VARARAETARGSAHALDLDGLRGPEITFWSVWEGDAVVGVGALKRLSADHGEERIVRDHEIDCGFDWVDGYLHVPRDERSPKGADSLKQDADLAAEFMPDGKVISGPAESPLPKEN
jgi:hypothetical protein